MAKLTAVCRSDDYQFERRQLPLVIDDTLTMVIQFSETCVDCGHMCGVKQKELETFVRRFSSLSKDEIAVAMMVTSKEILTALAHMVPCVGCRRSVERLFSQLTTSKYPALEPLVIIPGGVLSISSDCLFDPRAIYVLFYIHGTQLTSVVDSIPKSKKNKRCMLHSLDTHKSRASSNWMDIWSVLSQECREEVVLVDADCLLDTLDNYLRKHRFCTECKSKVMRAYKILVGDVDCTKEKGYCPGLYEGLRCCPQERHVHIRCSTEFIADLIGRAEPELAGSRRDRHAKTLDIAQEEVLTCLGIHIYDRLHRIWQKLHAEEQTWQILFYLGVDALKKNFELALEKKQGVSNLELMCEELLEEERAKEQKRQQKRQKRKKKRSKNETGDILLDSCIDIIEAMPEEHVSCKCKAIQNGPSLKSVSCSPRPVNKGRYCTDPNSNTEHVSVQSCRSCNGGRQLLGRGADPLGGSLGGSRSSDAGYSSGAEDRCDNCSVPSSNDGSDVVCSDSPTCNHHGCDVLCPSCYVDECKECRSQNNNPSPHSSTAHCKLKYPNRAKHSVAVEVSSSNGDVAVVNGGCRMALTLQDMLERSCSSEEDAELISEEEIKHFRANQKSLQRERQELRETLRQRFHSLQQRGGRPNDDADERCSPDLDQLAQRLCTL